jgi:hypothetical protein
MPDRGTEIFDPANTETLLQQIEEGLKRSREIIAQIDRLLVQRSQLRWKPSGFGFGIPNPLRPHGALPALSGS